MQRDGAKPKRFKKILSRAARQSVNRQRAFRISEDFYRSLIDSLQDYAVFTTDVQGNITSWNSGAQRILGYEAKEVLGRNAEIFFLPSDVQKGAHARELETAARRNRAPDERLHVAKGGRTFWATGYVFPLKDNRGRVQGYTKIMRDVTERKLFQERLLEEKKTLERLNKELDDFVYIASHDLRAPIRNIGSFVQFLKTDHSHQLDPDGRSLISDIERSVKKANELISDLLTLSKVSKMRDGHEIVDMNEVVRQSLDRFKAQIERTKARVRVAPDLPTIRASRVKMVEVFSNLIGNALKYSSKDRVPAVEVGYIPREEYHTFYVRDNGIGIDPKDHSRIFEMFRRLHTEEEFEGTGAGLHIVKKIIDDARGGVEVDSQLGRGATFYVKLPKDPNAEVISNQEEPYGKIRSQV